MKNTLKYLYVLLFMALSFAPICIWAVQHFSKSDGDVNIEKTVTAAFPQIMGENGINENFDDECETWINQNIPFRGELLSKINFVLSEVLKNPTANVVPGKDGWIYSVETMDDYMNKNAMTEEEIKAMGITLSLMKEKVESKHGQFLFVPVPNKNSIYPEYMPMRYQKADKNNLSRIYEQLDKDNISYVNLKEELLEKKNDSEKLYYKRDTHWNCLGAIIGYESIVEKLGKTSVLEDESKRYSIKNNKRSDLDKLLYPKEVKYDEEIILDANIDYDSFEFVNPIGVTDTKAQLENFMSDREEHDNDFSTKKRNTESKDCLYMIRDSFTRALLPYMMETYDETRFIRSSVPSFEKITNGSDVVYEICERNLKNVIKSAPVMYAPIRKDYETQIYCSNDNCCSCVDDGYAYKIYGSIDFKMLGDDGRIYLRLSDEQGNTYVFETFPICDDGYGFSAYIDKTILGEGNYSIKILSGEYESDIVANIPTDCIITDDDNESIEPTINPYLDENKNHQIVFRGVTIGIGDNINSLKNGLGKPTEPTETIYSCLSGTDAELYHYPNLTMETDMNGEIYYISLMEDEITDDEELATTECGITLGSDKMDIWKKLGTPTKENDKNCYFRTEHIKVTYSYSAGKVTSVILERLNENNSEEDLGDDSSQETSGIKYENGNTYLYDDEQALKTGWQLIDDEYYFFDRVTGERIVDQTVDGIEIGPDGEVDLSEYDKLKIETMIKAHKVVLENTLPTDTREEKRKKLFDWILSFPYHRYRLLREVYMEQGIEIVEANDIFDKGAGDCVSEAAALAFLFHEIGYNDVYWVHDTGHSWVRCEDRLYDPLFAEARDYDANYDAPFTDYRETMAHSLLIY